MTRISIRIEHKNLPLAASNILVEQMSPEEIRGAVASFEHMLPILAGDDTLTVSMASSVRDRETIYFISSSLEKKALISEIERTLSSLKLGGHILESVNEIKVGASDDHINPKI